MQGKEKKRASKPKKQKRSGITQARKQYNALKKTVRSQLMADKKSEYEKQNAKIKKLPVKQRAKERKKLRDALKSKHSRLIKQLKTAKELKSVESIRAALSVAKSIKW